MKIRMYCGIGYVGAEHEDEIEIDDAELDGMSEDEEYDYIMKEYLVPFANQYLDLWYEELED